MGPASQTPLPSPARSRPARTSDLVARSGGLEIRTVRADNTPVAHLSQLAVAVSLSVATLVGPAVVAHASDSHVYVVKTGDSLASIAANLQIGLGELLSLNHLTVTSLIVPGQHLTIPANASQ